MSLQDLQARLDALRARRQKLDIPAARERLKLAEANRGRLSDEPISNEARIERDKAREEFKAARGRVTSLEGDEQSLTAEIVRLEGLLGGEKRVEEALADLAIADASVAAAEDRVQAAEQALARVVDMIEQEQRDAAAARASAAQKLLEALNSGDGTAKAPVQKIGANLETLELTRTAAQQQVDAACGDLRVANRKRADVLRNVHEGRAEVAKLAFTIARTAYVQALTSYMAAHAQAYRAGFYDADPRSDAIEAAQRLLEAES